MISHISGTVLFSSDKFVIIDVGGIGYKVSVTLDTLAHISGLKNTEGQKVSLWTHLVVREDVLDLYGFTNRDDLEIFQLLIEVSGIGPKSALGILSIASVETLKKAIATRDIAYLTKVSGIGKKTAEKIVLELEDKIKNFGILESNTNMREESDALEALKSLGYSQSEAREALKQIDNDITDVSTRIKEALRFLGGK